VTGPPSSAAPSRLADLGPGIVAATSFAISDVFSKVTLLAGCDVLTLSTFRGAFSLVTLVIWLRLRPPPVTLTQRQRNISLGIGGLFAAIVFCLFKSIELLDVPVAVLTYFVYPLLTGIAGSLLGIDRLSWRGAVAAVAALAGLALMIGAHPAGIAVAGIAIAVAGACCRTAVLLITRAALQNADALLITWYAIQSSTAIFVVISLVTWNWNAPQTAYGWLALIIVSVMVTIAVLTLFQSTHRIGTVPQCPDHES
jgi:drug/metabolite transporter (DMT)-like permease